MESTGQRRWLAVGLWVLALVPYGGFCHALKLTPLWVLCGLFVLHAAGGLLRVGWLESLLQALAIGLVGGTGAATAAYQLAIWSVPARTADGHPVMPIGQAALGLVAGAVAALVLAVLYVKRWRHPPRRRTVGLLLHLAGAVTLGIAVYDTLRLLG